MRRQHGSCEDGAVAVIVAICMLLLFAAGAVAIDLGSAWETKRDLVVDTDAAALAGAQALESGDCTTAEAVAEDFLEINTGLSVVDLVQGSNFDCDPTAGTVRVDHIDQAQLTTSGALGQDSIDVYASSTARFQAGAGGGLRPLGLCVNDPAVSTDASAYPSEHTIVVQKTWDPGAAAGSPCNGVPGNWSWLCFEDNCEATPDDLDCSKADSERGVLGLLRCGYDGAVTVGDPDSTDDNACLDAETGGAGGNPDQWCWTKPGHLAGEMTAPVPGHDRAIDSVYCAPGESECLEFPILVYDTFAEKGGRTWVRPVGYLYVELIGYCFNNDNRTDHVFAKGSCNGDLTKFRFRVMRYQNTGSPGDGAGSAARFFMCSHDGDIRTDPCDAG